MPIFRRRASNIPLLLFGAATLAVSGCQSLRTYPTQEECEGSGQAACYLEAIQRTDANGIEQLEWIWHRNSTPNASDMTLSDEERQEVRSGQSLGEQVVRELLKAAGRVIRGGFGHSASHYGGAFS